MTTRRRTHLAHDGTPACNIHTRPGSRPARTFTVTTDPDAVTCGSCRRLGRTCGRIATYNAGCHCNDCRAAARTTRAKYRARARTRRETT